MRNKTNIGRDDFNMRGIQMEIDDLLMDDDEERQESASGCQKKEDSESIRYTRRVRRYPRVQHGEVFSEEFEGVDCVITVFSNVLFGHGFCTYNSLVRSSATISSSSSLVVNSCSI